MEVYDIIYDCLLEDNGQVTETEKSMMNWMGTDDLVHWFFHSYFANDVAELYDRLPHDQAQAIEEYYDAHCQG